MDFIKEAKFNKFECEEEANSRENKNIYKNF